MGFWDQIGIGVKALAIIWAAIIALWLLKVSGISLAHWGDRALRPVELRALQWLQDRAMARALNVPVEIVRARRRIETADKPVQTHAEKPIRY